MTQRARERVEVRTFTHVFEQMCNFVAVARSGKTQETINGLVLLCLFELPQDRIETPEDLQRTIDELFGIKIPLSQVRTGVDHLIESGALGRPAGTNLALSPTSRSDLATRIQQARNLELRVKAEWLGELADAHPSLDAEDAWRTLRAYLSRTFRRHGIQAAALLDPTIDTPVEHEVSLSAILDGAIQDNMPSESRREAHSALSGFLARVGSHPDRTSYITQLADGAFNFYALEVPQELSDQLRDRLRNLTLFLDTNFLFGILDLHSNSLVEVSHDLLRSISKHKLPFKLRYHEATLKEIRNTVGYYAGSLRSQYWPTNVSRAASRTRNLSGIEQKLPRAPLTLTNSCGP